MQRGTRNDDVNPHDIVALPGRPGAKSSICPNEATTPASACRTRTSPGGRAASRTDSVSSWAWAVKWGPWSTPAACL